VGFRGAYVYGSCGVLKERKAELPITRSLEWEDGGACKSKRCEIRVSSGVIGIRRLGQFYDSTGVGESHVRALYQVLCL
jgi:hypothetical protein